ncbi:hypothetical protein N2152v2_001279 [Parachlorella kessleri]
MSGLRNFLHSTYKSAAEKVLPARTQSAFKEKGVLTPEEFVAAGDYLIRTCPTWSWEAGDPKKARPYLPADKQFLITRNVPCLRRAAAVEEYGQRSEVEVEGGGGLEGEEEGWVTADAGRAAAQSAAAAAGFEEIPSISGPGGEEGGEAPDVAAAEGEEGAGSDSDVPDIADLDLEEEDEAALQPTAQPAAAAAGGSGEGPGNSDILKTRTYDLLISYDKYYQVPRFWLIGYDEDRQPLTPIQVLEDVSEEHARKTITMEPHPHGPGWVQAASIHPCRHANVMHKLSEVVAGEGAEFKIENYLVLFLKFIASVVPTIEYDYTMPAGAAAQ